MKKRIYFIVKNVTEFDHIIPLINSLDENVFDIYLDFFNTKLNRIFLEKKFNITINDKVKIGYFHSSNNSIISKYFLNYFFNLENSNINFSNLRKNSSVKNLIISFVKKFVLSKNFVNRIFFNRKWVYKKLKDISPNYLFIDNSFENDNIYKNLSDVAAYLNITTFEYPHSLYLANRKRKNKNKYQKNIILFNSYYEKIVSTSKNFLNSYLIYGSFKYDFNWQIKTNNKIINKNSDKINLIYVMTDFEELDKQKEIASIKFLLSFKNLHITVIPPSRDNFGNRAHELKDLIGERCVIDNKNSLSTFASSADIYVTSISGGIMDGIYNFKKIICLKYLCDPKKRQVTFFNFDSFFTFESFDELKDNFEKCLDYKLSFKDKKNYIRYMKKYVIPLGRKNIINNFIKTKLI